MTTARAAREDTFPKLIVRNGRIRPTRTAFRHKDLGIWQSWTWARCTRSVRAYASGLKALGLKRGGKIAVIGYNRPRSTGPWRRRNGSAPSRSRSMPTASRRRWPTCWPTPRSRTRRFRIRSRSTSSSRWPARCRSLNPSPLRRGARPARLRPFQAQFHQRGHRRGAASAWPTPTRRGLLDARARGRTGRGPRHHPLHVGHDGPAQGRDALLRQRGVGGEIGCEFDKLREDDEIIAYLPIAWVGDHIFSYAQAILAGLCVNCPEKPGHRGRGPARDRHDLRLRPPRVFENMLTLTMVRMEDASALKRRLFKFFIDHANKVGERILNREPGVAPGTASSGKLGDIAGLRAAEEPFRPHRHQGRLHGRRGDRPEIFQFYRSIGVNLKQLYGQTEASVYVTMQPDGEIRADTVGRPRRRSRSGSTTTARCSTARRASSWATTRTRRRRPRRRRRTASCARATPASSMRPATSRSSTARRTWARCATARCSRRNTSRTS